MIKPKKQTRRSISVRGDTYDKIEQFCRSKGVPSKSEFMENMLADFFAKTAAAPPLPRNGTTSDLADFLKKNGG